ncbi:hypothetical protein ADUPG1_013458 [Aduncisulcus paluster]|uniref:Uncharacterized protein n=1 Tax=Aduncisulcus paluster TaxID=2918883 RepID=A0ABQ5K2Z0_9EUKA|nr:hypothetical protein ADUPG1_013458 [Aduncisulcus paluster]
MARSPSLSLSLDEEVVASIRDDLIDDTAQRILERFSIDQEMLKHNLSKEIKHIEKACSSSAMLLERLLCQMAAVDKSMNSSEPDRFSQINPVYEL